MLLNIKTLHGEYKLWYLAPESVGTESEIAINGVTSDMITVLVEGYQKQQKSGWPHPRL